MKKMNMKTILIIVGAIATTVAIFFLATWYFPSSSSVEGKISCPHMRGLAVELDKISYDIFDLQVAIGKHWGTDDPQLPYWIEDLADRIKEFNKKAKYYNKWRKQAGHCKNLPEEYFLQEEFDESEFLQPEEDHTYRRDSDFPDS